MAPETKESFESRARAEGWKCSRCGKLIRFEDKETYREAGRCAQCHEEVDTESGTVGRL